MTGCNKHNEPSLPARMERKGNKDNPKDYRDRQIQPKVVFTNEYKLIDYPMCGLATTKRSKQILVQWIRCHLEHPPLFLLYSKIPAEEFNIPSLLSDVPPSQGAIQRNLIIL